MPYPSPSLYLEPTLYLSPTESGTPAEPDTDLDAWIPSPTLVARILRARIVLNGGVPLDDFTSSTNPTREDVADLIDMHAPLVLMRTGPLGAGQLGCDDADTLRMAVATIIAQRVALEVEASYWPEEVNESTPVDVRRTMIGDDLTELVGAIEKCRSSSDDGGTGSESDSRSDPAWRFPFPRRMRF